MVEQIEAAFGGIDVLVNIAGGFTWQTPKDGGIEEWQRMFAMNVLTAASMTKAALSALERALNGRIINIGAGAALKAAPGMGVYAAAKSAIHRLTEVLADEPVAARVTVNAILPSIIDTQANHDAMPHADARSWVQPRTIADVALSLASSAARAISGAPIPVTRGYPD